MKDPIYEYLMNGTKDMILSHAFSIGVRLSRSKRKAVIARDLCDYIYNCSSEWLPGFPQSELNILKKLLSLRPGQKYNAGYIPYITFIELMHIVEVETNYAQESRFSLTEQMHRSLKEGWNEAMDFRKKFDFAAQETLLLGILNSYGVIQHEELFDCLMKVFNWDEDAPVDESMLLSGSKVSGMFIYLIQSIILRTCFYRKSDNDLYYYSPFIDFPETVMKQRASVKDAGELKEFSEEEFIAAAGDMTFPFLGADADYGKSFLEFMKMLGLSAQDRKEIATEIWLVSQEDEKDAVFGALDAFGSNLTRDETDAIILLMKEYMDHVPRWKYKGYSSHEMLIKSTSTTIPSELMSYIMNYSRKGNNFN